MSNHAVLAVPFALGAAAAFAVANVAQMKAVRREPGSPAVGARLLVRLLRQPLWLAGLGASAAGFVLQAAALWLAPVVLVQPLIVAELLFALPLAAMASGGRLGRREWAGAGSVAAGLALFLAVIRPTDSRVQAGPATWVPMLVVVAAVATVLVRFAKRSTGIGRTSGLAAAAATTLGVMSVLTKATTHEFAAHRAMALLNWTPWALAVAGVGGLALTQNAFRSGPLAVSLPIIDAGEPLVASVIAVAAFGERLGRLGIADYVVLGVAAAVAVGGVALLDRSPLVQAAQADLEQPPGPAPAGRGTASVD